MIAVFCYSRTQFEVECKPMSLNSFKIIETENDLRGIRFNGIITLSDAFNSGYPIKDSKKVLAYNILKNIQPELF